MSTVVSMTKVKNRLRKLRPDLVADLRNVRVNENLRGCSGFVTDPATARVVYLNTEASHNLGALYRTATSTRDYRGGPNNFCATDKIAEHVVTLLADDRAYPKEVHA